jgi:hypothetical protein
LSYFGKYDLVIEDNCFKDGKGGQAELGSVYALGEGIEGNWIGLNRTHLAGEGHFKVREIEVYKVVFGEN